MGKRTISLPHADSPNIEFEDNFEAILEMIEEGQKRGLAKVAQNVVLDARERGTYENRTGNLRRLITSNKRYAYDDVRTYPYTEVSVVDSDGDRRKRKQYHPPADFDETVVEETEDGYEVVIAAIAPYAAIREAHGDHVLTNSVIDKALHEGLEVIVKEAKIG